MFCPVCRCEYIEGITQCVDCQVPLVEKIPDNPDELPYELQELVVIRTFPQREEAEIAEGLLHANGIDAITTIEDLGNIYPTRVGQLIRGVRVMVREKDIPRAEEVFKEAAIPLADEPGELDAITDETPDEENTNTKTGKWTARILLFFTALVYLIILWMFIKLL